ncbi:MAG: GNAT family N-acetyltransferase [Rhizobiaceae bacterium]|nr:GNAT family N-acetyltransferase [Rhizobiaceae bacterium]MCV0407594.1 GNAT family N-acetyltransferase [Rhizobiaceae bacterium]
MVAETLDEEDLSPSIDCPVLVTERLVLRPPHEADIPDLMKLANDRGVAEMLSRMPHPYGEREARDFVTRSAERVSGCVYAVTVAETGRFAGCAGLNGTERGLELGYWIGRPFRGAGYATEAAHALVDLAFRATDIEALNVSCRVINPASRRVIHKCGFQFAGQGMMDSLVAGRVPVERYRLDRRTWIGLREWPRG